MTKDEGGGRIQDWEAPIIDAGDEGDESDKAIALRVRIASCAPKMAFLLLAMEREYPQESDDGCWFCRKESAKSKHKDDCELWNVLCDTGLVERRK